MYRATRADQLLAVLGTFGLAALSPGKEAYPAWLVVAVIMLPVLLFELGAAICEGSSTLQGRLAGVRVQLLGAAAYLAACVFVVAVGTRHPNDAVIGYPLSGIGAILAARVWRTGRVVSREPIPAVVVRRRK